MTGKNSEVDLMRGATGTVVVATALLLFSTSLLADNPHSRNPHSSFSRAPVRNIGATPDPIPYTAATLRRFDSGLSMTLVSAVPVDTATQQAGYTVWWAVFNKPENCTNPQSDSNGVVIALCNLPDLSDPATKASVFWSTGSVVVGFEDASNTGLLSVSG